MQKNSSIYKIAIIGGGSLADLSILKGKRLNQRMFPRLMEKFFII